MINPMKYFLIAGEPSGDVLGKKLILALKKEHPDAEFLGIGGPLMIEVGLEPLLNMEELTVIGIWEVIMRLPQLRKIAIGLVDEIEKAQPDAVITIDFPDFNFAVGSLLKKRKSINTKLIHYVAPTVWAWRPGRAKKVAKFLDAMLCLFPFEPEYFKKHNLNSGFVGHPIIEDKPTQGEGQKFREARGIPADAKTVGLFFGSRTSELKNMKDIIKETAIYLNERFDNIHFIVPTLEHLELDILQTLQDGIDAPIYISHDHGAKWDAVSACDVAVAVSGTVALEIAYAGVPHVILYKANLLTYFIIRMLAKTKFVHLANIILDKAVVPEFLQLRCKSELIADEVEKLLNEPERCQEQVQEFVNIREKLGDDQNELPSMKAAHYILKILNK